MAIRTLDEMLSNLKHRVELLERRRGNSGVVGGIAIGTSKFGVLDPLYKTGGPARVFVGGEGVLSGPYPWRTPYTPNGSRVVSLAWNGLWEIVGQTDSTVAAGFFPAVLAPPWRSYNAYNADRNWNDRIGATKLPTGLVIMSGLIRPDGNTPGNASTILTLPPECRPEYTVMMPVDNNSNPRAVRIETDGRVTVEAGFFAGGYLSLDGLAYWAKDSEATGNWIPIGEQGSSFGANFEPWADAQWGPPSFYKDRFGFVWFQGLVNVKVATSADNTNIAILPEGYRSELEQHFFTTGNTSYAGLGSRPTDGLNWKASSPGGAGSWISLVGAKLCTPEANTVNTWIRPNFANGWRDNDPTRFPPFGMTRRGDGLVCMRGLLVAGTANAAMFGLPGYPEFHPRASRIIIATISNQAFGRIDFNGFDENGGRNPLDALPGAGISNAWAALDGMVYVP